MICGMFGQSCISCPCWASATRGASQTHAVFPRIQHRVAGGQIISRQRQGWASGGARGGASIAGAHAGRGQVNTRFQRQGPAKANHQPLVIMHQQLDRAFPYAACAQRPCIERVIGRPAKGEQRLCPQIASHAADNTARPTVHRIWRAIAPFGRGVEMRPKPVVRPQHQQGLCALRQVGVIAGMKAAQDCQMMCAGLPRNARQAGHA